MSGTILIVDDERSLGRFMARLLSREGFIVDTAHNAAEARVKMNQLFPEVVLMDLHLPDADGNELMAELREAYPQTVFIIVTGHGTIPSAVKSTRSGAVDYLTKPFEPEELVLAIQGALHDQALGDEIRRLRAKEAAPAIANKEEDEAAEKRRYPSRSTRQLVTLSHRAAEQDGIVLLLGESGTGKDRLARRIHHRSRRTEGPFFDINCAALSKELAESELFGHEPGAFTGTRGRKRGLLELAENGTLLLNEIGELDPALQSKLLSFLDTRAFLRVGGERSITVNARIFAATNRDLVHEIDEGRFRQDLYYRLNVFPIRIPSLRERMQDLPELIDELLADLTVEMGITIPPTVATDAMNALSAYSWPGNIRELRNVLERAIMLSGSGIIRRTQLHLEGVQQEWQLSVPFEPGKNLHEVTDNVARQLVIEALRRSKSKQQAADLLGISRHALAHQIKTLEIEA